MKNPNNVPQNIFSKNGCIEYNPAYGPVILILNERSKKFESFLVVPNNCHKEQCFIFATYFISASEPTNMFTVLDYEVFGIDYENRENINKLCKHPDIIMEYIETKGISDESLKQFDDDTELLTDLDAIHCEDSSIRVKISQLCLKNPSEFLPDTQLVNKQYDSYLREWVGNYKMKLLYRASEHDYTAESFHECCDNQGPTLIIIKSSGGWIFGGYTIQSWSKKSISVILYFFLSS